jgi:hypothetical protein
MSLNTKVSSFKSAGKLITGQEAAQHVQTLQMKRPLIGVRQPDILFVISDQLDT